MTRLVIWPYLENTFGLDGRVEYNDHVAYSMT